MTIAGTDDPSFTMHQLLLSALSNASSSRSWRRIGALRSLRSFTTRLGNMSASIELRRTTSCMVCNHFLREYRRGLGAYGCDDRVSYYICWTIRARWCGQKQAALQQVVHGAASDHTGNMRVIFVDGRRASHALSFCTRKRCEDEPSQIKTSRNLCCMAPLQSWHSANIDCDSLRPEPSTRLAHGVLAQEEVCPSSVSARLLIQFACRALGALY